MTTLLAIPPQNMANEILPFTDHQVTAPHSYYGQQGVSNSSRVLKDYAFGIEYIFSAAVRTYLEIDPVEDSYAHPAEKVIREALKAYNLYAPGWIINLYDAEQAKRPWLAADLLRVVGRMEASLITGWGFILAQRGLSHQDEFVRDAAVRALELWGGKAAKNILQAYVASEQVEWLADYASQVISELAV